MIVLVTGASSGFGAAIARKFVREGHQVIAAARRTDRLAALAAELGPALLTVELDVTHKASIDQLLTALPAEWQSIDVLVNNAGLALGLEGAHVTGVGGLLRQAVHGGDGVGSVVARPGEVAHVEVGGFSTHGGTQRVEVVTVVGAGDHVLAQQRVVPRAVVVGRQAHQLGGVARRPLRVRLGLEVRNLLDQRTIEDPIGNPLPGRMVMVTLRAGSTPTQGTP